MQNKNARSSQSTSLYKSCLLTYSIHCTGVCKKIEAAGRSKVNASLALWAKSISNHIYWCSVTSPEGPDRDGLVKDKWVSIVNHVPDIHEGHGGRFPQCLHEGHGGRFPQCLHEGHGGRFPSAYMRVMVADSPQCLHEGHGGRFPQCLHEGHGGRFPQCLHEGHGGRFPQCLHEGHGGRFPQCLHEGHRFPQCLHEGQVADSLSAYMRSCCPGPGYNKVRQIQFIFWLLNHTILQIHVVLIYIYKSSSAICNIVKFALCLTRKVAYTPVQFKSVLIISLQITWTWLCCRFPPAHDSWEDHQKPIPPERHWQTVSWCPDILPGIIPCCDLPLCPQTKPFHFHCDAGKVSTCDTWSFTAFTS